MLRWTLGAMLLTTAAVAPVQGVDYAHALQDIARAIAGLKSEYPQLADFDAASAGAEKITYGYHTHAADRHGGWTAGVPNPDSDGVWFYIDVHAADSTALIHTQPVIAAQCLGDKRVSFLILEGAATRPVGAAIQEILRQHGVGRCARPRRAPASAAVRIS